MTAVTTGERLFLRATSPRIGDQRIDFRRANEFVERRA